jgi:glutaredoxin-related protein
MSEITSSMKKILDLRGRFLKLADSKKSLLKMIDENEVFEQVYNSNAIENSTLSLEDTEKILLKIDLDKFISERELFESKNLATVIEYINNKRNMDLNTYITEINYIIKKYNLEKLIEMTYSYKKIDENKFFNITLFSEF